MSVKPAKHQTDPVAALPAQLAEAEAIKNDMTELLAELEHTVIAKLNQKPPIKPGGWRHHPTTWAAKNLT